MTSVNTILSDEQQALLTAVLNRIVPANGEMPAAGELGVAEFVAGIAAADGATHRRRILLDGLAQIEIAAQARGGAFAALPPAAQTATLQAVADAMPAFFQELVTQTYRGYYTNETVFDLLQYRAPNRADYNPKPFDESLLEPVRQRGPIWAQTAS